jgi:hypothetical protein
MRLSRTQIPQEMGHFFDGIKFRIDAMKSKCISDFRFNAKIIIPKKNKLEICLVTI